MDIVLEPHFSLGLILGLSGILGSGLCLGLDLEWDVKQILKWETCIPAECVDINHEQ